MTHNNQWAVIEESAFGETEVDYFSDEDTAARCAFEREVAYLCDYSGELGWGPHHEACKWPSEADAKREAEFWSSRARGSRLYREQILVRFVGS